MSCCGAKRSQFHQSIPNRRASESANYGVRVHVAPRRTAYFEYIGPTGLTVAGPVTGARYRFDHTGATVPVDHRDAPSFVGIPNLRRLSG